MSKLKIVLSGLLALSLFAALLPVVTRADELQHTYQQRTDKLNANLSEQTRIKKKLSSIQSAAVTLSNQVAYFNNQIRLLELQIEETQGKIGDLQDQLKLVGEDIGKLQDKLTILDGTINELEKVLGVRVRAAYQLGKVSPLTLFLKAGDFYDNLRFYTYLKALQGEDKRLMKQMKDTRGAYLTQKAELESLKKEKEDLRVELEKKGELLKQQEASLGKQRADKKYLLELTQNEEANYQGLLKKAQDEQKAIENAINEVLRKITGRVLQGTAVKADEIIGIQGSTGFSTGEHLHFGYYPCGNWSCPADPRSKLNDGSFLWPIANPKISQGFGLTAFARTGVYGYDTAGHPKIHNGIDMVGPANSAIKAAHNGTVYYTVDGWGGQGAIIQDKTGFMTIYWHLKPKK